ncbi:MAG: ABC-type transport auxiliary lipoprotein family protein [Terricaulis sp.]
MKSAVAFAPLLLLGGCISLLPPPPPPPAIYVLEAEDAVSQPGAMVNAVIGVAAPSGERTLLGSDLIWRDGVRLSFLGQAQWSSRADAALQSMLIETLTGQRRFRAVVRSGEAHGDYELRWEVRDFEVRDLNMTAIFRADVMLVALPERTVVAQEIINGDEPVSARTASAAAQALARAAREGSARIGEFAARSAAQDNAASINR